MPNVSITKVFRFAAAHALEYHGGKCREIHGHTYLLEVTVSGWPRVINPSDPQSGMIMDFGELKALVHKVTGKLDHSLLNDHFSYPTAELMALQIFEELDLEMSATVEKKPIQLPLIVLDDGHFAPPRPRLEKVRLWEEIGSAYSEVTR